MILDSHHDEAIIWADLEDIDKVSGNLSDLWTQIAAHFQDYDQRLVFESFNEINTKDNSRQFQAPSAEAVNILNQLFVDTVRAAGGNNANRILICDTYLSETTDDVLNGFILPEDTADNRLAVSVHSYDTSYNQDIKSFLISFRSIPSGWVFPLSSRNSAPRTALSRQNTVPTMPEITLPVQTITI